MKLRFKRSLALLLCLALLGTLLPALPAQAEEIGIIPIEDPAEAGPVDGDEIVVIGEEPAEPLAGEPTIAEQPQSITKTIGYTAKFTVVAGGATKYQWYYRTSSTGSWHKSTLTGCTSATLSVVAKTSRDGYQYRCRISNARGAVYTRAATLTATEKPVITAQPESVTKNEGTTAKFTVKASGATGYQWYYRTGASGSWHKSTLSTAAKATLSLTATAHRDGYQYRCRVSNSRGTVYTRAATLTVASKPVITAQPQDTTVSGGEKASFRVVARDADAYLWVYRRADRDEWEEVPYSSKTSATLTTTTLTYLMDGCQFRCKVSNTAGSVWSRIATVTVKHNFPAITVQPTSQTLNAGASMTLSCQASGGGLSYQWYWRDSGGDWRKSAMTGAATATLFYSEVNCFMDGRQFRCLVSNDIGSVYTDAVTLTVRQVAPTITAQPADLTGFEGREMQITVKAAGGGLSYRWYWRDGSAGTWTESTATGAGTATLCYESVKGFMDGRQFRCLVSNDLGAVYTRTVTLTVDPITCRALLIGQTYKSVDPSRGLVPLDGDKSVQSMETVLGAVNGILGHAYRVTALTDVSRAGWSSAIRTAFAGADENDVSLFYFFGHGNPTREIFPETGAMVTVEAGGSSSQVLTAELAEWLDAVPGTVVVLLDCCGSGASIYENGGGETPFPAPAVQAFAGREAAAPNAGELRGGKYYVLTSTTYDKPGRSSWDGGYFTTALKEGLTGGMPADTNGDGKATLAELHAYLLDELGELQTACAYPENSDYVLFTKK